MNVLVWAVQPISAILRARSTLKSWALPYVPRDAGEPGRGFCLNRRRNFGCGSVLFAARMAAHRAQKISCGNVLPRYCWENIRNDLVRPRSRTDEGMKNPKTHWRKRVRSSGDENAQKLLGNRGLMGALTGVTLDGSDRLKKNAPRSSHALASDAPPPNLSVAASCTPQKRSGFAVGYGYRPDLNSHLLGLAGAPPGDRRVMSHAVRGLKGGSSRKRYGTIFESTWNLR